MCVYYIYIYIYTYLVYIHMDTDKCPMRWQASFLLLLWTTASTQMFKQRHIVYSTLWAHGPPWPDHMPHEGPLAWRTPRPTVTRSPVCFCGRPTHSRTCVFRTVWCAITAMEHVVLLRCNDVNTNKCKLFVCTSLHIHVRAIWTILVIVRIFAI